MFLRLEFLKYDNHTIYPTWRLSSDHAFLTVNISIFKEHIQTRKHTLVKNSKEENKFINKLIEAIKGINMENIQNEEALNQIIQSLANVTERICYNNSKIINIMKHSKEWWNKQYCRDLENY